MSIKNFISFLVFIFSLQSFAQLSEAERFAFRNIEDSIRSIQLRVFHSKKAANKIEANKQFIAIWNSTLKDEKSMLYPFDSIKKDNDISILMSPDKKFRIITWNIVREDETHGYFGFLQVNNSKTIKKGMFNNETTLQYDLYPLVDKSAGISNSETYLGDPSKWFGMLYYGEVIKLNDEFYTLFGWDGNTKITQRKFIDILWFKPDGTPQFGKDVFRIGNKFNKRVMFEYASEVAMSLKFNGLRKQIIYSHLAPNTPDPALEGQFQYYGPDGTYDALSMKKDKWTLEADIDIRKDKDKNDNAKRPEIEKQTPIYKPK